MKRFSRAGISKCSVRGCDRKRLTRAGLCKLHHTRMVRYGRLDNEREMHGLSRTPEYTAWKHMVQRCTNPNCVGFSNYGGRGIRVCRSWKISFLQFLRDMGERKSSNLSIERIDNESGYYPKNCMWATRKQNARNRRPVKLNMIIAKEIRRRRRNGELTTTLAKEFKIQVSTIVRICQGRLWA